MAAEYVETECPVCGKSIVRRLSQTKGSRTLYCSSKCVGIAQRNKVVVNCGVCGAEIEVWPSKLRSGGGKFCSLACTGRYNSTIRNGMDSPGWKGDDVVRSSAHSRVVQLWGPAKGHPCIECGKQAKDWAYDGTDPTQKYGASSVGSGKQIWGFYSTWPEFYMPMCRKCHKVRDGALLAEELRFYRTLVSDSGMTREQLQELVSGYVLERGLKPDAHYDAAHAIGAELREERRRRRGDRPDQAEPRPPAPVRLIGLCDLCHRYVADWHACPGVVRLVEAPDFGATYFAQLQGCAESGKIDS